MDTTYTPWFVQYQVPDVPEGKSGPWEIDSFTVSEDESKMDVIRSGVRAVRPGTYKRLRWGNQVVMSDTPAELRDHDRFFRKLRGAESVLIHGLGIGCAVNAAIKAEVDRIDVVELSEDVIALVGDHYLDKAAEAGVSLQIHQGDALTYRFTAGRTWDVAWHDIWTYITPNNLPTMHRLHRRYGRRVGWQASWCRWECERGR